MNIKKIFLYLIIVSFIISFQLLGSDIVIIDGISNENTKMIRSVLISNFPSQSKLLRIKNKNNFIIKSVRLENPKVIIAIGKKSSEIVKTQFPDKKIIFTYLLKYDIPRKDNYYLIYDRPQCDRIFGIIHKMFPSAKSMGMFDTGEESNYIDYLKDCKNKSGLFILNYPGNSLKQLNDNLITILPSMDLFYLQPSQLLLNNFFIKNLILNSVLYNKPVISFSGKLIKYGVLMAFDTNYKDIGEQAVKLAKDLLYGKKAISHKYYSDFKVYINKKMTKKLNIKIPFEFLNNKKFVIE